MFGTLMESNCKFLATETEGGMRLSNFVRSAPADPDAFLEDFVAAAGVPASCTRMFGASSEALA